MNPNTQPGISRLQGRPIEKTDCSYIGIHTPEQEAGTKDSKDESPWFIRDVLGPASFASCFFTFTRNFSMSKRKVWLMKVKDGGGSVVKKHSTTIGCWGLHFEATLAFLMVIWLEVIGCAKFFVIFEDLRSQ